jgi:phage baseplate assembly protein V
VRLPWLPDLNPWARVAVLEAGLNRGTYFIPQIGDEVLVAFNQGDVREPFVVGSLWNGQDRPPALLPTDATTKRKIRTRVGHEIEFDELTQTITVTNSTQQKITIDPTKIEISTVGGAASVTLNTVGTVSIQAAVSLELKAPKITIDGANVDIKAGAGATINGGAACTIQAALVKIN